MGVLAEPLLAALLEPGVVIRLVVGAEGGIVALKLLFGRIGIVGAHRGRSGTGTTTRARAQHCTVRVLRVIVPLVTRAGVVKQTSNRIPEHRVHRANAADRGRRAPAENAGRTQTPAPRGTQNLVQLRRTRRGVVQRGDARTRQAGLRGVSRRLRRGGGSVRGRCRRGISIINFSQEWVPDKIHL